MSHVRLTRKHGNTDFYLTQMNFRYGRFVYYLYKYKKRNSQEFVGCQFLRGDAEHTIFRCDRRWKKRTELKVALGAPLEPDIVIELIVQSKEKWMLVKKFVGEVISTKEGKERKDLRKIVLQFS